MAQISVGKLLPNLKVTLGNDVAESEHSEDGEISDLSDEETSKATPNVQIVRSWMNSLQNPKVYKNKTGGFTTGLDLLSENNAEKLGKRAERFGLEKEECAVAPNINALYESMGISIENKNSAKMKNIRLEALHMRGINELNTNEIFDYFRDYAPSSVEWINDFSCNVVWLDEISCARALLGVSKPLEQHFKTDVVEKSSHSDSAESLKVIPDQESSISGIDSQDESMDVDSESQVKSTSTETSVSLDIPIPPGLWRLGVPHAKAKTILLRFATKDDKKLPGAEKRSDYYKKYGNPNYGGLKGLISSSRKRRIQAALNKHAIEKESSKNETTLSTVSEDNLSDASVSKISNPKPPPRMRMYADDEELKLKKLWPSNNFNEKQKKGSVHSRLGTKYTKDDLCYLGVYRDLEKSYSDQEDEYISDYRSITSKNNNKTSKRNWPSENQTDLRSKLKKLRNDNVKKHRSPLCIDSDNESKD